MEKTFVRTNEYFMEFNSYLEDLQNEAKNLSLKQSELDKKQQKDNSFSTTVLLRSQTHDQIFAAQFHNVHHHDYQPNHKRP